MFYHDLPIKTWWIYPLKMVDLMWFSLDLSIAMGQFTRSTAPSHLGIQTVLAKIWCQFWMSHPWWTNLKPWENLWKSSLFHGWFGGSPMTYPHPHTKQNAIVAGFSHPKKTYAVFFSCSPNIFFVFCGTKQIPSPSSPKMPWHWPSGWLWACDPQASCRAWLDRDLPECTISIWWLIMAI